MYSSYTSCTNYFTTFLDQKLFQFCQKKMDVRFIAIFALLLAALPPTELKRDKYSLVQWFLQEKCSTKEMTNVQCIVRARSELDDWLEENNEYTILIAGKTGTGKTTFIKGFTENFMPGEDDDSLLPHTVTVAHYLYEYEGIKIRLYDTPGLSEVDGVNDHKYLKDMVKNDISPDLIVFFIKMDDTIDNSLRPEDEYVIKNVSDTFGWARWRFALFVLSFANRVYKDEWSMDSHENKFYFTDMHNKLTFRIRTALKNFNVQQDVVNSIPVIPVGLVRQPIILSDARENVSWTHEFWSKAFNILKEAKREETQRKVMGEKEECCPCSPKEGANPPPETKKTSSVGREL